VLHSSEIAAVIVTNNHAHTLPACLHAVLRLEGAIQDIIVVDNASTDSSADIAESAGVRVIREDRNTGFAAAANRGIAATSSPWVLSLNPDCAPRPGFVTTLLEAVEGSPAPEEIAAATGKLLRASGDDLTPEGVIDAAGMVVTPAGRHFDRGAGEAADGRYEEPAWVFGGSGAACLYRRAALVDVAYHPDEVFAPTFFAYREDAELAWRLQWRGWRCLYVPRAVAAHRRGFRPEHGRRGHEAINRHSVKNRFLMRLHCADGLWHLRCFPWWLLRDLLVVAACLSVERSSAPALLDAWRLRRDALARRRWVMSRAKAPSRRVAAWFRKGGWVEVLDTP
jgi:GT2 family glycosyltransferase